MSEWIKLSDQIPNHNQRVLLHFDDGEIETGYCKVRDGRIAEIIRGGIVCKYKGFTHWMPLPQPPS